MIKIKLKVGDIVKIDGDVRNSSLIISRINYKRNLAWVKSIYHRYVWQFADNANSIELTRLVLADTIPGSVEYAGNAKKDNIDK